MMAGGVSSQKIAKAENCGKRFRSFSEIESLRRTGSARFGIQSTNGSKALVAWGVFLAVVPEPCFPQGVTADTVVGNVGFAVRK